MAYSTKRVRFSKRFRRGFKKRRYALKKRAQRRGTVRNKTMVKAGRGFPKKMMVTHTYVENITLSSPVGAQANQLWKCNGMFDPNQTGTGHQPLYFDQMSALYDHYVVIGSKMTLRVTQSNTANAPTHVLLRIDDDSSVPSGTETTMEQTGATYRVLSTGGSQTVKLTRKWSAKKWFGGSILANTELQGTATTDPTELSFYQLAIRPMDGSSSVTTYVQATITYIAIWKELKDVAGS